MAHKSPMDIEIIRKNYSGMETEDLLNLLSEITSLTPEALEVLRIELIGRGENKKAHKITEYFSSSRFLVPEEWVMNYLLVLRKKGLRENDIDKELMFSFGIDQDYVNFSKSSLKAKGKENLLIGIVLVLIPLVLIILSIIRGGYYGLGATVILGFGLWRMIKGINLLKKERK